MNNNFIRGLTESPLDTTIRQLKDLGVETEGLMRLEQIQLARTISELNNELKNTGTEYKDIESINKRIKELGDEETFNYENESLGSRKEQVLKRIWFDAIRGDMKKIQLLAWLRCLDQTERKK